ncbi:hypothetical protein BN13_1280006 [Nostocoides jenkinsii Ben 74]|jgi:deazaflavin-dependent oxidoreductase (nitroreductase family)|uniref:Nitroreductase family deazaflavin-dependent oxidoreductase n=1 Tax=Nostocoides jenkinsii Ben 74 TaxID=1193518 RepID=A0A077M5L8_9MICO|nr:hypothetical protein BN13_1280006 [Tetrasphaera jenkinsii Ben 74]
MAGLAFPPRPRGEVAELLDPAILRLSKYAEVKTIGRRSGLARCTTVCFAWSDGAIYVLAHRGSDGRPGQWLRNVCAAGSAVVSIGGLDLNVTVDTAQDEHLARALVIGLLRHKYGGHAVTSWHPSTGAVPVRLVVDRVAEAPKDAVALAESGTS